jgi:hypothetical protein
VPAADYFFLEPRRGFLPADAPGDVAGLILFVVLGILISIAIDGFHRTRDRLRQTVGDLQQSEQRLQNLAATVPEILFTTAPDGSWDYVSQHFFDYTGLAPQPTRAYWMEIIHPDDRPSAVEHWANTVKTGAEYEATYRIRGSGGQYRWFKTHAKPVREPDGTITKWTGVCSDIHEHKLLEEALAASNDDFQKFAYRVAHDLKEPLRMIGTYSEMLLRRNTAVLDSESRMFAGYILTGVNRVESQMRDLLEYARAGSLEMTRQLLDLNAVLDSAVANLQPVILETEATVTHGAMPSLVANSQQVLSIFQNLIGNALKYRSSRAPRIHVEGCEHGKEWIFSVEDNGAGIDMKDSERIFLAFERASSRTADGNGLGLAIVKRLVDLNGGRVWVNSEVGRGSTFFFAIPRTLEKMGPLKEGEARAQSNTSSA